jgi:hypothetical protein
MRVNSRARRCSKLVSPQSILALKEIHHTDTGKQESWSDPTILYDITLLGNPFYLYCFTVYSEYCVIQL